MHIVLPHQLTTEAAAILRAKQALTEMRSKLPANASIEKEEWSGNTFTFAATVEKTSISGTLVVTDTDYDLTAKLPLMFRMFEGRIEKAIKEQTAQLLKQKQ